MKKSQFNQPNCIKRMNASQDKDTIYMLEDCDDICKSKIKEAEVDPNKKNIFLSRITVECFDYMNGPEEKEYFIDDLKNIFYFVKIINPLNMERNEINFLVLKEQVSNSLNLIHDEENEILEKINNKACLGNKIKKILNIDEFPLENYILEKETEKVNFYDKIYNLKKKINNSPKNINIGNISNNNFKLFGNDNNRCSINSNNINVSNGNNIIYNNNNNDELIDKINNLELRINGIERKLDLILEYIQK
jgi:hypothetical protein